MICKSKTWYAVGPLSEEEACLAGGTGATIVAVQDDPDSDGPGDSEDIAEFYSEKARDRAITCVNFFKDVRNLEARMDQLLKIEKFFKSLKAETLLTKDEFDVVQTQLPDTEEKYFLTARSGDYYNICMNLVTKGFMKSDKEDPSWVFFRVTEKGKLAAEAYQLALSLKVQ